MRIDEPEIGIVEADRRLQMRTPHSRPARSIPISPPWRVPARCL